MKYLLLVISFFITNKVLASSCCGGSAGGLNLITGDDDSLFMWSVSQSKNLAFVDEQSKAEILNKENKDITNTVKIDYAKMFGPYGQTSWSIPIVQKSKANSTTKEDNYYFGDFSASAAYEFYPETVYSYWRPRVWTGLKIIAPTGISPYQSKSKMQTDVTGQGFWRHSFFLSALKKNGDFDFSASVEAGQGLKRSFGTMKVNPSWNVAIGAGMGLSFAHDLFHFSAFATRYYFGPKKIEKDEQTVKTSMQYYWDAVLALRYKFNENYNISLQYSDQTIFGPAKNTLLATSFGLVLARRLPL